MNLSRSVVFLHGAGSSFEATFRANSWTDVFTQAGRSIAGIDLPGHGKQGGSRNPDDYADLAGLVAKQLPEETFDAVGFSLGAKILLELAIRFPNRIRRMVLGGVGDNIFAPEQVAEAVASALEHGPTPETPPGVRAFLETWDPSDGDALALAAVLRRPSNPEFTAERLEQIRTPILVVNGSEDQLLKLGDKFVSSSSVSRHITLKGVGHFDLPVQQSFILEALEFLNKE